MSYVSWINDVQRKALEDKADRLARARERAYNRKKEPDYKKNMPRLWNMAKRAATKGLNFDLTIEWLDEKMMLTNCEATGLPFNGAGKDAFGLTIDRKDSAKGYTQDNCWAVCWIYNRAKMDNTHEDVMEMVSAMSSMGMKAA